MKTLIKLAKTNKILPILQQIQVKDGLAMVSNLKITITTPCNKANGNYHIKKIAADIWQHETDLMNRLPELPELGESYASLSVSHEDLSFVARAMSNEQARYYLNGVCFDNSAIVATDGHRLHFVKGLGISSDKKPIIPAQAIDLILELQKQHKHDGVIHFYAAHAVFMIGETKLIAQLIDGNFPDWQRVLPKDNQHKSQFDFKDFKTPLKDIKATAKAYDMRHPLLKIMQDGSFKINDLGPNKTWPCVTTLPFEIGFDAELLADTGLKGNLSANTPTSPIMIEQGNYISVVMPTRL